MGKKYDAYVTAAKAEGMAKARYDQNPTEQNERDARQAEEISNVVWNEFTEDPEG